MDYTFTIPGGEHTWYYDLLRNKDCQAILCEGTVVMYIWKEHNHKYCFEAFFYKSMRIISKQTLGTKKELYETIQKLLQKELYGAGQ